MILRRVFIRQMFTFTGGLVATRFLPKWSDKKVKGKVHVAGKGIAGVVVSDGYSVVATGKDGKYSFNPDKAARAIFISIPSGYEFPHHELVANHYKLLTGVSADADIDFELSKLKTSDHDHRFVIWADPQVKNMSDVEKMMNSSVPDVQKWVASAGAGTLLHGITVGDIVWDEHKLFPEYNKAVGKMGIPFFQCLGNHDMDYTNAGDETSDVTFTEHYGPTYYSFNRGDAHYVVMDNVRYLGKDRDYDGFFQQNQLDWLAKDLSFVSKDKLIILCCHIPVHSGTKNNEALYSLLEGRDVHIMSGHTHYHNNNVRGSIYEHNHGTVCGAWWTGPICGDGTPCGYGVYNIKGKDISWHYQSTGLPADHQLSIHVEDDNAGAKKMRVNIWNHDAQWKTEYIIDGQSKGGLQQVTDFDPLAYATLLGPDLPKPRGFAEPRKTEHMFIATIPATAKSVKVIATDRFGKSYSSTHNI
jgi:hypothetical protein